LVFGNRKSPPYGYYKSKPMGPSLLVGAGISSSTDSISVQSQVDGSCSEEGLGSPPLDDALSDRSAIEEVLKFVRG
jgi:hypothetical protein